MKNRVPLGKLKYFANEKIVPKLNCIYENLIEE